MRGFGFAALAIAIGTAAFLSANNLLFLLLSLMLAALLVSGFVSRLGLAGLEIALDLPEHLSARVPAVGAVTVRNHKRWSSSYALTLSGTEHSGFSQPLYFPVIPGGGTVTMPLRLEFPRRGRYREDAFSFATRFPFGFTERRATVAIERDIVVYPSIAEQPGFAALLDALEGEIASRSQGRGEDFHRIRPYEASDSVRRVDWKATAHTGALQVREFVQPERPEAEIMLDLGVPESQRAWFERAVDCCAFLGWSLHLQRASFRLVTQSAVFDCRDGAGVHDVLRYLALVEPQRRAAPLDLGSATGPRIVLSPPTGGEDVAKFMPPQ